MLEMFDIGLNRLAQLVFLLTEYWSRLYSRKLAATGVIFGDRASKLNSSWTSFQLDLAGKKRSHLWGISHDDSIKDHYGIQDWRVQARR